MNTFKLSFFVLLTFSFVGAGRVSSPEPTIFVASTPCDMIPRQLLSIAAPTDCEFITWHLALNRDPRNQVATTYRLRYTYGMSKPGTQGFLNGGTTAEKEGKWTTLKSSGKRETYQLNPDTPETAIYFTKLNDNLLHLLDPQGGLMVGHAGWSYTLNQKK